MAYLTQYSRWVESSPERGDISSGTLLPTTANLKDGLVYGFPGKTALEVISSAINGVDTSFWEVGNVITFSRSSGSSASANIDLNGPDGAYTKHWKILGIFDSDIVGREWIIIDRKHTEGTVTEGSGGNSICFVFGYNNYGDTWTDTAAVWSVTTEIWKVPPTRLGWLSGWLKET